MRSRWPTSWIANQFNGLKIDNHNANAKQSINNNWKNIKWKWLLLLFHAGGEDKGPWLNIWFQTFIDFICFFPLSNFISRNESSSIIQNAYTQIECIIALCFFDSIVYSFLLQNIWKKRVFVSTKMKIVQGEIEFENCK